MPLVDLKTDLTSLKFGKDRPGGGSSREPFVKGKSLDKRIANDGIETLASTGGRDMFIRGGFKAATSTTKDLERLGKYFSTVEGGLFTVQQNLLSSTGVRIYGGYPISITASNSFRLNDGVYTPLSTLAAAAGVSIGGHPNKQGTDPTGLSILGRPEYLKLVKGIDGNFNFGNFGSISKKSNNRLVNLYNSKITNVIGSTNTELYSYLGGPGAGKGGSKTIIKIASDRTLSRGYDNEISFNSLPFNRRYSTLSQNQLQNYAVVGDSTSTLVQDFRKNLTLKPVSNISQSPNYLTQNIEQRVNLGDPGKRGQRRGDYARGNPSNDKGLDQINSLYLYRSEFVTTDKRKNDLVKFRIATIDNTNPKLSVFTHFRAFINSFTDSMNGEWNTTRYTGRGENFYTYQGFTNTVNMSFTVAVQSIQELSVVYKKLNYLKSTLAPSYSENGYIMGNIHKLTIGGYFYETPGIIDSLTYTIPQDSPWEIGIPSNENNIIENSLGGINFRNPKVKELPLIINVDMSFKPIYKFLPSTVENIDGSTERRFISLENEFGQSLYDDIVGPNFKVEGTFSPDSEVSNSEVNDFLSRVDNANDTGDVVR